MLKYTIIVISIATIVTQLNEISIQDTSEYNKLLEFDALLHYINRNQSYNGNNHTVCNYLTNFLYNNDNLDDKHSIWATKYWIELIMGNAIKTFRYFLGCYSYNTLISDITKQNEFMKLINLAMLYYERDIRWKQGGTYESLNYTNQALSMCSNGHCGIVKTNDDSQFSANLYHSLLLHKSILLKDFGWHELAMETVDSLLLSLERKTDSINGNNHNTEAEALQDFAKQLTWNITSSIIESFSDIFTYNKRQQWRLKQRQDQEYRLLRSNALYQKAELLLTAWNQPFNATLLYSESLDLYPCVSHNIYLQLFQAKNTIKPKLESKNWENWISELEYHKANIHSVRRSKQHSSFLRQFAVWIRNVLGFSNKDMVANYDLPERDVVYSISRDNNNCQFHTGNQGACNTTNSDNNSMGRILCSFNELTALEEISSFRGGYKTIAMVKAGISWALFHSADSIYRSSSNNTERRNRSWHYLQQARYYDRQRIKFTVTTGTGNRDYIDELSDDSYVSPEEAAALSRSNKQRKHIQSFYHKDYWHRHSYYRKYTNLINQSPNDSDTQSDTCSFQQLDTAANVANAIRDNSHNSEVEVRPVFIVGFFRSGSTLLESLLEKYSSELYRSSNGDKVAGVKVWGIGEDSPFVYEMYALQTELLQLVSGSNADSKDLDAQVTSVIRSRAQSILSKMKRRYRTLYSSDMPSKLVIIDKMLTNYYNIGLIHLLFPQALILHTVRDPLDTLASCYSNRLGDNSADFTLYGKALAQRFIEYLEIMQHFRSALPYVTTLSSNGTHSDKNRYNIIRMKPLIDVRYEELVTDTGRVVIDLLRLIIPTLPMPIQAHSEILSLSHDSQYPRIKVARTLSRMQVTEAVYKTSIGRWRRYQDKLLVEKGGDLRYGAAMVAEFRSQLPRLKNSSVLPCCSVANNCATPINWDMSPHFDYE